MYHFDIQIDEPRLSPTNFILRPPEPQPLLLELDPLENPDDNPEMKEETDQAAKTSSKEEKKRLAGVRSREKKKKYVENLEESVKHLTAEIQKYELQISQCKDQLVQAIKVSNQHSNQHAYTFGELEKNISAEDPDIDRINLLLDLIQNRIGANAKERQANLDYTFKQIINSMFPAMHRYLMHSAAYEEDIFQTGSTSEKLLQSTRWTKELFRNVRLNEEQLQYTKRCSMQMKRGRYETILVIKKLKKIKQELKKQQQIFQQKMGEFREDLTPIQAGLMAVFGQRNKWRRQFELSLDFNEDCPKKRIKIQ